MSSGYAGGKPDVEWWLGEIRRGIAFRRKYTKQAQWSRWRSYYRGEWPAGVLPVNLFFRMLRTVVPRIYFRNPSISIQPSKPGPEQAAFAQLIERIDNKLIRTMRMKDQMKKIVHQTWMFGSGFGKRGFAQEFLPGADALSTTEPSGKRTKQRVEYNSLVQDNMPWFMKVATGDFIMPAGTVEWEDSRWYANWIKRPKWEVQNDPRLKNTASLTSSSERKPFEINMIGMPEAREDYVDMIEIHDVATGKVMVLSPYSGSGDKALAFEDDRLLRNNRAPYYRIVFNDDDEVAWGVPDSVILEPQQLELNEIRTLEMKHRRLAIMKLLYKKDSIDIAQLENLLNGRVAAAVEIRGELSDIDQFQMSDVPPSLRVQGQEVLNDVRESMGFSRNQAGNYSDATSNPPTATEAQIVQIASEIRIDERRDMLADMLVDVFEDIHADIFDYWREEQVIQVMGPTGVPVWVAFKPQMLKAAQFDLQIDPDTTVPETKQLRMQKAVQTYGLLKTNPLIDPELLSRYLLHELHGVQFDNMMRSLQQAAAQGTAGATADKPINAGDYIRLVASAQAGGNRG